MLIIPITITCILVLIAKKRSWNDNALTLAIIVCWATYMAIAFYDAIGEQLGWWETILYY